jgi:hypothetical protein
MSSKRRMHPTPIPVPRGGLWRRTILGVDMGCTYGCMCGTSRVGICDEKVNILYFRIEALMNAAYKLSLIEDETEYDFKGLMEKIYGRDGE